MFSRSNRLASLRRQASPKIPGLSAGKFYQDWLDGHVEHDFMTSSGYTVKLFATSWKELKVTINKGEYVFGLTPSKRYLVKMEGTKWVLVGLDDQKNIELSGHIYTALVYFFDSLR